MSEPNGRSADDWFHDYCEANQRARQAEARAEKAEARAEKAEADNARLREALQTAESALSLEHHRGQYDLVDKALSKVCTALYGNKKC